MSIAPAPSPSRFDALTLDFPRPKWQHEILELLIEWGYDNHGIDCVFQHLSIFGSAEGNPHLGPEERPIVESLLPESPDWLSDEWDAVVWMANHRDGNPECACPECAGVQHAYATRLLLVDPSSPSTGDRTREGSVTR